MEGTALANGEEVEQVNSYLSRAAHITKRMLPSSKFMCMQLFDIYVNFLPQFIVCGQ